MSEGNGNLEYKDNMFKYVKGKSKRVVINNTTNKEMEEKDIRELDFLENVRDLSNNIEDIVEDIIDINDVCRHMKTALKGDIKEVVKDLNECWGYDFEVWQRLN